MSGPNISQPFSNPEGSNDKVCGACGAAVAGSFVYCPACGTATGGSTRRCPSCSAANPPAAKHCISCGTELGEDVIDLEPLDLEAGAASEVVLAQIDESGTIICNHDLKGEETTIGREDAHITFADDTYLSPLHAQISSRTDRLEIRDLGSKNGTWIFIEEPYRLQDGDRILVGSQIITFRRLGYPGPRPPELDATRRLGSLTPNADIAVLTQLRSDGSSRDQVHLSPGRNVIIGREQGDWTFPYDPSMSGAHAEVKSEDADFILVDVGSRNGTAVAVRGEKELHTGSRFLVGDKMLRVAAK